MTAPHLPDDERDWIIDRYLRSHPWVAARIAQAPPDADAATIAGQELRNGAFLAGDYGASTFCAGREGITVERTPSLGDLGYASGVRIRWREVAARVRGTPRQLSLLGNT